jgi:glycosyltransferase involved in cell wall biosynthesis
MVTKRLKVLFVIADLSGGGAQKVLVTILHHLDRRQFIPMLVISHERGEFLAELDPDVKVYFLERKGKYSFFRLVFRLARILRDERPEIAMSLLFHANVLLVLARMFAWFSGAKVILSEHISRIGYDHDWVGRWMIRILYPFATRIVAVSKGVKEDLSNYFAIAGRQIEVIYNPVDLERIAESARMESNGKPETGGGPVVVAVGRMINIQKGFDVLLKAFRQVRMNASSQLVFIGDGPDRAFLEEMASDLGVKEDVRFLGFQINPYKYMARSTVFAFPSIYEGFGCVLVEAMSLGLPVVSTDCPHGPSEIITQESCGLLVPVGDENALARALLHLLQDDGIREKMAVEAKNRAESFSAKHIVRQYEKMFSGLTEIG